MRVLARLRPSACSSRFGIRSRSERGEREDRSSVRVSWATRGLDLCQVDSAVCHSDELGNRTIILTSVVVVVMLGQQTERCALVGN